MCLKFLHCTHIVLKIRYFNCCILSSELKQLNTRARYKRRGALGTPGSFVNQPSWHTELQNGLSCSGCKALTRGAFLGKSGKPGVISIRHSEADKIFFFLVTSLLSNVPMLQGEVDCSSFLGEEEWNTLHTVDILHNLQNTHKYSELSTDGEELGGITWIRINNV